MALFAYQQQTQRLIRDIAQKDANPADLIGYINEGRVQLAGESMAIKVFGQYSLVVGQQGPYPFSAMTLSGAVGVSGVLNVSQQWYQVGTGQLWFRGRPWPWFSVYFTNSAAPEQGSPRAWAQYGEGVNGTLYVGPPPDAPYVINADCVGLPVPLVDDTTVEAIPVPWTTAVPYYAAYLALLAEQTSDGDARADKMFERYSLFVARARGMATPDVMPSNFRQQRNPVRANQLGGGGGGGGSGQAAAAGGG